jgi:hypothetical protein
MAITSYERPNEQDPDTDRDAGIRKVQHREPANLKKVQHIPTCEPVDEVADGTAQRERRTRKLPSVSSPGKDVEHQARGYRDRDRDEDRSASRKDAERTARIVHSGNPKEASEKGDGLTEGEARENPSFESTVYGNDKRGAEEC